MDWSNIATQIILGIVGALITGLGTVITLLINKYVKNKETAAMLSNISEIVMKCVQETYQTYVQELKDKDIFDAEAQKTALNNCISNIKSLLTTEMSDYLSKNYADVEKFLKTLVESAINTLKITAK